MACNYFTNDDNFCFQTEIVDDDKKLISAVDLYFVQEDGSRFRVKDNPTCYMSFSNSTVAPLTLA